ncbi:guanylyl cyclase domain containing 1 [Seminavis robusta]|uniref:Guanylyl cyclase domain containing 1 n=1 Tax=Seminavis robusta TaxID=568900 RepID=A0A9N8EB97_9STRA|nr:guanylyl cyclase domain containing 1 [Seminavis robusta]|eukprot:Sro757_g197880.1 guanylyl cyclase domain containing 1 (378) ;mRNA; f:3407-4626
MALTEMADSRNEDFSADPTSRLLYWRSSSSFSDNGTSTSGFSRLLACCGISRKPIASDLAASTSVSSSGNESDTPADFDAAATKLLKGSLSEGSTSRCFTHVTHIRQTETWDCGIACLMMVLRWLRSKQEIHDSSASSQPSFISTPLSPLEVIERKLLLQKVGTQSIWTVDLVMLLEATLLQNSSADDSSGNNNHPSHNNTTYLFASQVMGADLSHSTAGYYQNAFAADSVRVQRICDDMIQLQLPMLCPFDMAFHQLIRLVSREKCIAIVLVDNGILMKRGDDNQQHNSSIYMGHYVIVSGISQDADHLVAAAYNEDENAMTLLEDDVDRYCLVVANPGVADPVMFVTPRKFEQAWRADGTDCDVLFVTKHEPVTM